MTHRVWKFGDNVDTDLIIAARYLNTSDEKELASHLMEDARGGFAKMVACGDVMVAGENFGCGSSREHAPIAIKASGVYAVIAKSFARIFYRNAFNIGLPVLELKEAGEIVEGDLLKIDMGSGTISIVGTGNAESKFNGVVQAGSSFISRAPEPITYNFKPIPAFMLELLELGGLMEYAKKELKGAA